MLSSKLIGCWHKKNQSSAPCDNDVIMSDWVRHVGLCHLEFYDKTLDLVYHMGFWSSLFLLGFLVLSIYSQYLCYKMAQNTLVHTYELGHISLLKCSLNGMSHWIMGWILSLLWYSEQDRAKQNFFFLICLLLNYTLKHFGSVLGRHLMWIWI